MNNTYNQAAQLRAQEMANARGLYGGLSGQMRDQDIQRLGMGNNMALQNAGLMNQYRQGYLGAGAQYGNLGLGYYNAFQNPYNTQFNGDVQSNAIRAGSYNNAQGLNAQGAATNAGIQRTDQEQTMRTMGTMTNALGQTINAYAQPTSGGLAGTKPTSSTAPAPGPSYSGSVTGTNTSAMGVPQAGTTATGGKYRFNG
jgi:hypothetical protein